MLLAPRTEAAAPLFHWGGGANLITYILLISFLLTGFVEVFGDHENLHSTVRTAGNYRLFFPTLRLWVGKKQVGQNPSHTLRNRNLLRLQIPVAGLRRHRRCSLHPRLKALALLRCC